MVSLYFLSTPTRKYQSKIKVFKNWRSMMYSKASPIHLTTVPLHSYSCYLQEKFTYFDFQWCTSLKGSGLDVHGKLKMFASSDGY